MNSIEKIEEFAKENYVPIARKETLEYIKYLLNRINSNWYNNNEKPLYRMYFLQSFYIMVLFLLIVILFYSSFLSSSLSLYSSLSSLYVLLYKPSVIVAGEGVGKSLIVVIL